MKCPVCGAHAVTTKVEGGRNKCLKCRAIWRTVTAKKKKDPRVGLDLPIHYLPPACVEDLEWLWRGCAAPAELP